MQQEQIEYVKPKLQKTPEGLVLTDGKNQVMGDFLRLLPRLKQSNLEREMLVKAVRMKGWDDETRVLDATAGMGEDSLLLAAAGFTVTLYEQDAVIAALLQDTMERAIALPELSAIVGRMELVVGDSIAAMRDLGTIEERQYDVIFLDPMFPERQKSALVKKKFQLLQQLEQPCTDEAELLQAAITARPKKIVIKRPLKGPFLAGRKPDYSLSGKAIRYDCIVNI